MIPAKKTSKAILTNDSILNNVASKSFGKKESLQLLDTDYKNYALMHKCSIVASKMKQYVFILSRYKKLDPERLDFLNDKIRSLGISLKSQYYIDQTSC